MKLSQGVSDFVLTGCAVFPGIALGFGQPEIALLSHIVLLFAGILVAGMEDDAPFKHPEAYRQDPTGREPAIERRSTPARRAVGLLLAPLHRRSTLNSKDVGRHPRRR